MGRKKSGGRDFPKGVSGNPAGRPPAPPDLREAKELRKQEFQSLIFKYMDCTLDQITDAAKNPATTIKELIILKFIEKALKDADVARYNLLIDRSIGQLETTSNVNLKALVATKTLHDQVIEEIENDN